MSITLISWNVNGIRSVGTKEALRWVDKTNPDILCLQEIKALPEQLPEDLFTTQFLHRDVNSATKKGYSGTATFSMLDRSEVDFKHTIDTGLEGRIIQQEFDDFTLFNVYFPNGQKDEERLAYKMKFYDDFLDHCNLLRSEGRSIIICGDVNTAHKAIDLANPKANSKRSGFLPMECAWMDRLVEDGYIDTFRYVHGDVTDRYSWWSNRMNARENNVGWRIDYFFISDDLAEYLEDAFIWDDIAGSDHCPVGITLSL